MPDYYYNEDTCPDSDQHSAADRCSMCGYRSDYAALLDSRKWGQLAEFQEKYRA